jgi:hypothetical protein
MSGAGRVERRNVESQRTRQNFLLIKPGSLKLRPVVDHVERLPGTKIIAFEARRCAA